MTTILSGNPRPGSRTLRVAELAARSLDPDTELRTVELSGLTAHLFDPDSPELDRSLHALRSAELAVVATPSHKGSFTGLLKSFLDRLPPDGLQGLTVVPLVVAASTAHLVQTQQHLGDVLLELGADLLPGLSVAEHQLDEAEPAVQAWHSRLGAAELVR